MALIRFKEAQKLNDKDRREKLADLRLELVRANVTANKSKAKTRELKRAIARLLTIKNSSKKVKNARKEESKK